MLSKQNKITVYIPSHVESEVKGYTLMAEIYAKIKNLEDTTVTLDFTLNKRFEANLCSILGSLVHKLKKRNNNIEYLNLPDQVRKVFSKNGFLPSKNNNTNKDVAQVISFQKFKSDEESKFMDYINAELLMQPKLPKMSPLLKQKINKSIFEIFNNAFYHGKCDYVFTCGQYYPVKQQLDFTIVDLGKTIRYNVNKYLTLDNKTKLTSPNAIAWAVEEGNTTKTGTIPGGLGLSLIREFLKLNKGRIQIVSAMGIWELNKENILNLSKIRSKFGGTIVNLEFNLNDKKSYILKEEIDPSSIF